MPTKPPIDSICNSSPQAPQADHEGDPSLPPMSVDNTNGNCDASPAATKSVTAGDTGKGEEQNMADRKPTSRYRPPPSYTIADNNTEGSNQTADLYRHDTPESWQEDEAWDSTAPEVGDDDSDFDIDLGDNDIKSVTSHVSHASTATVKATSPPAAVSAPPKGWPVHNYDPSKPFAWFRLPVGIRHAILGKLLVGSGVIRPYFNAGSVYLPGDECGYENIDTSLLYTGEKKWNRQWYEDATDVLYGQNVFEFMEPRVARWWCERIGRNLKKVKKVVVVLSGGPLKGTNEFLWVKLLHYLRLNHNLFAMYIDFRAWRRLDSSRLWRDCGRWREEILLCLLLFRGLQHVELEKGHWYGTDAWHIFENIKQAMVLKHGEEVAVVKIMKKLIRRQERLVGLKGRKYSFK
ncbi:MAG: hypothetical protein Q9163_004394 [Psora crenata]